MNSSAGQSIRMRMLEARHDAGLTQAEAAKELKIARQTLSKWETGKSGPDPEELLSLCLLYDVTPDWIVAGVRTIPVEAVQVLRKAKDFQNTEH